MAYSNAVSTLKTYPVILSGGSGTRLWPLSRAERPKQFISLVSDRTMMQDTILRTCDTDRFCPPIIVSSHRHGDFVSDQIAQIGMEPAAILLEPMARNTAAAIALAAHWIVEHAGDGLMLVMPSDHVIADLPSFHRAIELAMPAALAGRLITFGIQPTHPETGFGYVEKGDELEVAPGVHRVNAFHEKPLLPRAEAYVASGNYFWNGGIFLFTARTFLDALDHHAPAIGAASKAAMAAARTDGKMVWPDEAAFANCPDVSVDYAVMEKTTQAAVVSVDMGWSDVGSWDALWDIRNRDDAGNSVHGKVICTDGRGNLIYVDGGPPVAALGMENCVIVSTAEGVMVIPRSRSQDVKIIVDKIRAGAFA